MTWIREQWRRFRESVRRNRPYLIISGLVVVFILLFELPHMVVVIESGEAGVEYRLFFQGTITDHLYAEGVHFILPWNRMYVYNTRIQEVSRVLPVLTKDGLEATIELSIRYHPEVTMLGVLHQQIGPDYAVKIAIPEVESAVRSSVGDMTLEELYEGIHTANQVASTTSAGAGQPNTAAAATGTEKSQGEREDTTLAGAIDKAVDQASKKYVLIDNVLITRIRLPLYVQTAIEKKVEQEQITLAETYKLQQARVQAQENITLSQSLTPQILQLKGIEATEKLAASPNAKVVVVGNGPNSLPVILEGK